ncbi:hypothetical protein [Pusillimonas sp.]|uniref:hypothetical protein n=1 Tax=Pusillimonas sp. TaxID=3040095 RepID=UPI0037CC9E10
MNLTSLITRITRKVYSVAVSLHIHGLRAAVAGANLRVKRAHKDMNLTRALADSAVAEFERSVDRFNREKINLDTVRFAAIAEAKQIGGAL